MQRLNNIRKFFLATSTLLQVPVPVPVLKIQIPVQVPVLRMQVEVPVPVPQKNVLKYNLSTSTKYNKTAIR